MKKITLLLFYFFSASLFSQETEFKLTKDGFTDYIVTPCEGKMQTELYKKTLDWISVIYNTPSEVLKGQIENDYIRIEGSSSDFFVLDILGKEKCNAIYQIEISFKDGKYKFDVIEIKYFNNSAFATNPAWKEFNLAKVNNYYNKKGEIKSTFKYLPETLPKYFNDLNSSLKSFLLSEQIPSKKKEW